MLDSHALVTDLGWTRETVSKNRMKKRKSNTWHVALGSALDVDDRLLPPKTDRHPRLSSKKSLHECISRSWQKPHLRREASCGAYFKLDRKGRLAPLSTLPAQPMGTTLIPRRPDSLQRGQFDEPP